MHSSNYFIALALQAACLTAATPLAPRVLNFDEVAVVGLDGRMAIMNEAEYRQLEVRHQPLEPPSQTVERQLESLNHQLRQRDCDESSETQVISDTTFTNWDVPMSPIIGAQGGSATVAVSDGYSIANRLHIDSSGTIKTALKAILQAASAYKETNMDTTWTSTQSSSLTFQVPDGQYGLVVSQPLVRRVQGNIFSGCTDSWTQEEFTLDSYTSQSYGDLSWVQGVITLCNSTTYPVPYCNGEGFHE